EKCSFHSELLVLVRIKKRLLELQKSFTRFTEIVTGRFSVFVNVGHKFFVSDGETKTISEGGRICQKAGGKLALPRNEEENQKLSGALRAFGSAYMFIGANDQVNEGQFVDTEGRNLDYLKWNTGEPNSYGGNEDCIVINTNGFWLDTSCEKSFLIACEITE
uniref:C-type lectin domain-containing protein n=1 Tax=Astyanax mexicanus TaxID=7994 RepID=A0A3B1IF65_ASTMX